MNRQIIVGTSYTIECAHNALRAYGVTADLLKVPFRVDPDADEESLIQELVNTEGQAAMVVETQCAVKKGTKRGYTRAWLYGVAKFQK